MVCQAMSEDLQARNAIKFLFWNLNRKPIWALLSEIVSSRNPDLIILAECEEPTEAVAELNRHSSRLFHLTKTLGGKLELLSCLPEPCVVPVADYSGLSFRRVIPPLGKEILLVGVHLPSKMFMSGEDQVMQCTTFAAKVKEVEEKVGHQRTVVVGDFNLNPFDVGLVSAQGFHACISRSIAKKGGRVVSGERYPFFYNPMWNCLGDGDSNPPGTYFYEKSSAVVFFWNMFDQVIIRPEMITAFLDASLEIISCTGEKSLLKSDGRPDGAVASDHLPLMFALNLLEV